MRRRGRVNASASDGGMSLPHSSPQHLSLAVPDFPIPVICDAHTSDRCHTPHTGRLEDRLRIQRGSSGRLAEEGDDRRPRGPCDFTLVHTDSSLQALEPWPRYCNRTFGVREVTSGFWRGQTLSWRQAGRAAVGCPENGWPLEAQPVFASGPPQSLPGSCVGPIHRCIRRLCSRSYTCAWHSEDVAMFPGSMSCCSAVPPSRLDLEKHVPARRPHWPREHIVLGSWEAGDWLTGTAES